jgi:hypothetical protein
VRGLSLRWVPAALGAGPGAGPAGGAGCALLAPLDADASFSLRRGAGGAGGAGGAWTLGTARVRVAGAAGVALTVEPGLLRDLAALLDEAQQLRVRPRALQLQHLLYPPPSTKEGRVRGGWTRRVRSVRKEGRDVSS